MQVAVVLELVVDYAYSKSAISSSQQGINDAEQVEEKEVKKSNRCIV
jgi:hypothetical protein